LKLFDLNRKYPISCVRFSPDGKLLVISCFKDLVVFNAQSEDFDQEGLLKGNTQQVIFLQFDKSSQFAMTNSIDGQILVWELMSGEF
jgi:WD40 repeat protein